MWPHTLLHRIDDPISHINVFFLTNHNQKIPEFGDACCCFFKLFWPEKLEKTNDLWILQEWWAVKLADDDVNYNMPSQQLCDLHPVLGSCIFLCLAKIGMNYRVSQKYPDDFLKMGVASKWVKPRLQNFLCFLSIIMANFSESLVTIASIFPLSMALLD